MTCPFCGSKMHRGWIRARGYNLAMLSIEWEPTELAPKRHLWFDPLGTRSRGAQSVLRPGFLGRHTRAASHCNQCGTIVTDPKDTQAPQPST